METITATAKGNTQITRGFVAAVILFFALWCFIDGYVKDISEKSVPYKVFNKGGAPVCFIWGLYLIYRIFWFSRYKLSMNDEGLTVGDETRIGWDRMRSLNLKKWFKKGIAYLSYEGQDGKNKNVLLDAYEMYNIKPMVEVLRARVSDIVGNVPPADGEDKKPEE